MCGINGIVSLSKASLHRERVLKMNQALAHRGPDSEGIWNDENVVLGHRRLAIIDLSEAGHQPMLSASERYVLVYNGEIYNFRELRQLLTEYCYKSNTDSEVLLAAYERWGVDCMNHFNGMFSFAIWDRKFGELLLVRDRLGIKPLYYYPGPDFFLFSSEIRALLSTGLIPRKLSQASLVDYLRYQTVQAPDTIIEGISMLMPGSYILLHHNENNSEKISFESHSYWQISSPGRALSPEGKSKKRIRKDIFNLLSLSVERRLVSDVPFGAFLSGGIDSSAIVGLMSQVITQPVNTFSVIFDDKSYSEEVFSRKIANRFHTSHQEIYLRASDMMNMLPEALSSMDHPTGDGLNTWVISKVTKNAGIDMALSGLGGDELFAGYDLFKRLWYLNKFRILGNLPPSFRKISSQLLDLLKSSVARAKAQELLLLGNWKFKHTYPLMRSILTDKKIAGLISYPLIYENRVENIVNRIQTRGVPFLSQISTAEFEVYMSNILLRDTDQMSMKHALEVRVPFLDFELVEYVLQVNDHIKYPYSPKQLLVESLDGLLPKEISQRKKMGFVFPWEIWMRNDLKSFCESNLRRLSEFQLFHPNGPQGLWSRFMEGDPQISWSRIWLLVVLAKWLSDNKIENY
jgi:asparagine synthase (glutamine-hydrolysing)